MASKSSPKPSLEGAEAAPAPQESPWLNLARQAYEDSTDWMDANLRRQWERNIDNFRSRHPSGSKYHTKAYQYRSKLFRPKIRSSRKSMEAAAAAAFFVNDDRLAILPGNHGDEAQVASAAINEELANYRLKNTIPWFTIVMGAVQDGGKHGIIITHQYWKIKQAKVRAPVFDERGESVFDESGTRSYKTEWTVVEDKPCIELVRPENFRIDPASDWTDPIGSSPYIIHTIPMHISDVMDRVEGRIKDVFDWRPVTAAQLVSSLESESSTDSTRTQREAPRQDRYDEPEREVREHEIVWLHKNIIRRNGVDYLFYTAGTTLLLTRPLPLLELYPHLQHRERPYTFGYSSIESHVTYPDAPVQQAEDLQAATNDISNLRLDNVRLAINGRYLTRREQNIDLWSFQNSVPGGGIAVEDPNTDVRLLETRDVTASSYAEQDRIQLEMDELLGNFSNASVQSNRAMNETVGGMNIMSAGANLLTEYEMRTIAETWMRPCLQQLVRMEQFYETDEKVIALAAQRAKLYQRFGIDRVTDELLRQDVLVFIVLGLGATNPVQRVQNFMLGVQAAMQFPQIANRINVDEVTKEIFSTLGFGDGTRFITPHEHEDPRVENMQSQLAQLQQVIEQKQIEARSKQQVETIRQEGAERVAHVRGSYDMEKARLLHQIQLLGHLIKDEAEETKRGELELQRDALLAQLITQEEEALAAVPGKAGTVARDDYGKIPHSVG